MITLPLADHTSLNYSNNKSISVKQVNAAQGAIETKVITPNSINSSIDLVYPKLTLADCFTVETALLETKGTERIAFNNNMYVCDGYEVIYSNSTAKLTLTLIQVS